MAMDPASPSDLKSSSNRILRSMGQGKEKGLPLAAVSPSLEAGKKQKVWCKNSSEGDRSVGFLCNRQSLSSVPATGCPAAFLCLLWRNSEGRAVVLVFFSGNNQDDSDEAVFYSAFCFCA
ncbi:hypothetical protein AAC387_Pa05g0846 [Persea americana]